MPVVWSNEKPLNPQLTEWWYNSLDCCVTAEVFEAFGYKNEGQDIYAFERALQGPALDMMLTGFRIDDVWRRKGIYWLEKEIEQCQVVLDRLARAVWGKGFNPRSPKQKAEFFYDAMGLPVQYKRVKGESKITTDRDALEKLLEYYTANPFINLVLHIVDASKTAATLRSGVDSDGRMRCSYGVCGTETGRWNSTKNVYGRGMNLMNVTEKLRRMFIADPGFKLLVVDGETAESRAVGFREGLLFNDWRYLDACEGGDLHTAVSQLVWPNLGWSQDEEENKAIANQLFYRWFSYRFMAKRGGHATNYYGKPWTVSKHLKVPQGLIEDFQRNYFRAFPAHSRWHTWVAGELIRHQRLTNLVGRERTFFGRPNDDATLREAIAYDPQSSVGDIINEGGLRCWREFCLDGPVQILGQCYDSYTFQYPEEQEAKLVPAIMRTFEVPLTAPNGRKMVIPAEAKIGWNWSNTDPKREMFDDGNPDGLVKFKGPGQDHRTRSEDPEASLLDRILY